MTDQSQTTTKGWLVSAVFVKLDGKGGVDIANPVAFVASDEPGSEVLASFLNEQARPGWTLLRERVVCDEINQSLLKAAIQ